MEEDSERTEAAAAGGGGHTDRPATVLKDTLSKKSVRTGQRTRGAKHKYRQVKTNHFKDIIKCLTREAKWQFEVLLWKLDLGFLGLL